MLSQDRQTIGETGRLYLIYHSSIQKMAGLWGWAINPNTRERRRPNTPKDAAKMGEKARILLDMAALGG